MATTKKTYREPDDYFPKEIRDKYFPNLKKDTKATKKTAPKKKASK